MSSRISTSTSSSSKSSTSSKNIQKTIDLLLQSTEGAKTILAKITDKEYLYKLFDINSSNINSSKAGEIIDLIHVRIIQVLIKNKIEEELKIYRERRIELETQYRVTEANALRLTNEIGFDVLNESITLSKYQLKVAKELHRKATEMLQNSLKSGNLHIEQGNIEGAVKRVGNSLDFVADIIRNQIGVLKIILQKRSERISRTEVGRRLSLNKSTRGQQQPHLLKGRN